MGVYSFFTIENPAEGLYREKGSKFLAFAWPVQNEEEVKQHLAVLKKKYFDARHHCFAWVLGPAADRFRAFDDGEPNHTAGDPILGQIRSRNLTQVLVVVVRYFGGVKLGVGGLISAYRHAADDALNNAVRVEREIQVPFRLTYLYNATPEVMRLIKEFRIRIVSQDFTIQGELNGEVRLCDRPAFEEKVRLLQALGHSLEISGW